jgi:hypothetical protein
MDPIEIRIRIIVSKDGNVEVVQEHVEKPITTKPIADHTAIEFICRRFAVKVGKKEAGTCHGCTVQCHMKGKYKTED